MSHVLTRLWFAFVGGLVLALAAQSLAGSVFDVGGTGDTVNTVAAYNFTGAVTVQGNAGTGSLIVDGDTGGCLQLRDTDNGDWSYCSILNGTLTCSTTAC